MKITIENPTYKQVVSVELKGKDDADLHIVMEELILPVLKAVGYSNQSIAEYLKP